METPRGAEHGKSFVGSLSKTQKRKSIGEQAKREKQALASKNTRQKTRSTVINPIIISWPTLPEKHAIDLTEQLQEDLKILKGLKTKPSLKVIRELPKAERSAFRKKFKQEEGEKVGWDPAAHEIIRRSVALGVNSVSRGLENNALSVVIVETAVDPQIMTKLLIPMAEGKGVPIIALTGISDLMCAVAGFKCIAIGFKCDTTDSGHPLHILQKKLIEFSKLVSKAESMQSETCMSRYKYPKIRKTHS